jgi:hypothetical protein
MAESVNDTLTVVFLVGVAGGVTVGAAGATVSTFQERVAVPLGFRPVAVAFTANELAPCRSPVSETGLLQALNAAPLTEQLVVAPAVASVKVMFAVAWSVHDPEEGPAVITGVAVRDGGLA